MIRRFLKKYHSMSVTVKASLWFTFCSVLAKGMSFLTVPIFTRIMSIEEYGYVTLYNSWLLAMTAVCTLQATYGGFYNGMIKFRDDKEGYTSATLSLTVFMSLAWMLVYLLFRKWLNGVFGLPTYIMVLMFIEIVTKAAFDTWVTRQKYDYNYRIQTIATLFCTIISAVLGVILVLSMQDKVLGRVLSLVVPYAVISVILCCSVIRKGKKTVCLQYWKFTLGFCIPLLPHHLSQIILSQSDRLMINHLIGTADAALYGFSYNIGALLSIFSQAINTSFIPWLYKRLEKKEFGQISKSANSLLLLMAGIVVLATMLAPEAVWILGGAEYAQAVHVVPPIVAGCFFMFVSSLFSNAEMYYEKKKIIMAASVTAALLNLVLNYIFIPLYGYVAAGYTTLVCYLVMCVTHYAGMKAACKEQKITEQLYDMKAVGLVAAFVMLFSIGASFLYSVTVVRYIAAAIMFVMAVVRKKEIINAVKGIRKK